MKEIPITSYITHFLSKYNHLIPREGNALLVVEKGSNLVRIPEGNSTMDFQKCNDDDSLSRFEDSFFDFVFYVGIYSTDTFKKLKGLLKPGSTIALMLTPPYPHDGVILLFQPVLFGSYWILTNESIQPAGKGDVHVLIARKPFG
ncbi:MAG: hypothetical protein ACTSU9_14230 [Promethearchaeota archaeon]